MSFSVSASTTDTTVSHFAPFDVSNITAIFLNKDYVGVVCFEM